LYRVVNYQEYRAIKNAEMRRVQNREAQQRHRKRQKYGQQFADNKCTSSMSAQAEAEAEAEAEAIKKKYIKKKKRKTPMPKDFEITDTMKTWANKNNISDLKNKTAAFIDYHLSRGNSFVDHVAA